MRIAFFSPSWPPGATPNGIVTYVGQIAPALRQLGHEVFVVTGMLTKDDPYAIDLSAFPKPRNLWYRLQSKLLPETAQFESQSRVIEAACRELFTKHRIDVLEIEESFGWSYAISRLQLFPTVVRLHGPWFLNGRYNDPGENLNHGRIRREGLGIAEADLVTAPSAEVLQAVKSYYALDIPCARVIPNPIDVSSITDRWDLDTCDRTKLLYVGRFDRRKGGDIILRAFANLAHEYSELSLTFVGPNRGVRSATGEVQTFDQFLSACIPDVHHSKICFLGELSASQVESLRSKHFATIVASQYEILPYSVLEAMSFGCPLVATAVGGIPELVSHKRNGLLVPSQDVDGLTAACRSLVENPQLAMRIGSQAWEDCRGSFASRDIAERTVVAYEQARRTFDARRRLRSGLP